MKKLLFALFYFTGSFGAYAVCPQSLSEDKEITLSRSTPLFEESYKLEDGFISKTVKYNINGNPFSTVQRLINGLIVIEHTRNNNTLNVFYKSDHNEIAALPETKIWRSEIDIFKNGKLVKSGEDILEFIQVTTIKIADCTYDVWELKSTTVFGSAPKTHFIKFYSPKLKLVLKTIYYSDETLDKPISEIIFDKIQSK